MSIAMGLIGMVVLWEMGKEDESRMESMVCDNEVISGDTREVVGEGGVVCGLCVERYHRRQEMFSSRLPCSRFSLHLVNSCHTVDRCCWLLGDKVSKLFTARVNSGAVIRRYYERSQEQERKKRRRKERKEKVVSVLLIRNESV